MKFLRLFELRSRGEEDEPGDEHFSAKFGHQAILLIKPLL